MDPDPLKRHLWLYIEEPALAVPPGTDWEEVRRTRIPPTRLAPDQDDVARKATAQLLDEGWSEVEVLDQGWDDHPQQGRAWWISIQGIPPDGSGFGDHIARHFEP